MLQVGRASYIKFLTPPACNSASSFKMLKTNFPNINYSIFYLYFLNIIKFSFNILTFYFQTIHFYFLSANHLASILFTCIIMNSFYLFQRTFLNNGFVVEGEVWSLKSKWKRAGGGENSVKKLPDFQTANIVPSEKLLGSCWKFY